MTIGRAVNDAASKDNIENIVGIMRPHGRLNRLHWNDWNKVTDKLQVEDIVVLAKGLTFMEVNCDGWASGSVSAVIWIFRAVQERDTLIADILADWLLAHTNNPYVPFGTQNYGSSSLLEYRSKKVRHNEAIRIGLSEKEESERQAALQRDYRKSQRFRSVQDRNSEKRSLFVAALNVQPIATQLSQLAYDDTYAAEFYPTRCAHYATQDIIDSLDVRIRLKLLEKLKGKHKGPWGKFKRRLLSSFRANERGRLIPWDHKPWFRI